MLGVFRRSALRVALAALALAACNRAADDAPLAREPLAVRSQALGGAAPVNSLPTSRSVNEDSPLHFSATAGNLISVQDPDSRIITVQITVTNGTFWPRSPLPTLAPGETLSIAGAGTFSVIFSGNWTAINNALDGARYVPAPNYFGSASLQVNSSDDDGNSTVSDLAISVTGVNDPPVNNVPSGTQGATEDVPFTFNLPVSDIDVGTGELQVTLTSSNNTTMTLPTIARLAFTKGDGLDDVEMTFTGPLADINAALNGLTVTPPLNYIGQSTLTITSNDLGSTGLGGPASDSDRVTIGWNPVNDPPVNSVPGPQSIAEEGSLTFSAANSNALSVSDVDATTAIVQVTLNAVGGTLTLGDPNRVAFIVGDGTADPTMTFSGKLADINAALEGTVFTGALNFNGTATVEIISNDLGNSGAGGARQDIDQVTVSVSPVNDPPRNTVPPEQPPQSTNEDVNRVFSSGTGNAITVSDVDAASLQVTLTATNGTLTLSSRNALNFQQGSGTNDTTMKFTGPIASVNSALNGLIFSPTPNYYGPASLTVVTDDLGATGAGGALRATDTVAIDVISINDPPDAVNDAYTLAEDAAATAFDVLANDTTLPDTGETLAITAVTRPAHGTATITGGGITYQPAANYNGTDSFTYTVSDGSGGTDSATVTVTVTPVNDEPTAADDAFTVLQNAGPTTLSVLSNDSALPDLGETLTISSVTTPANGTAVVSGGRTAIAYTPAANFAGIEVFGYTISDGNGGSASATVTVTVVAVNTKPVNTLPPPQQTIEDSQLVFSTVAGNALSVTDANSPTLTVQVMVTNGTFTLGSANGLTVTGNATTTVTAQGTIAALNNGLNNARYLPSLNFNGPATLTLTTSDSDGNNDVDVLTLTVTAVNDGPVNNVPVAVQLGTEDVPLTFTTLSVADVDVGESQLLISLSANNGTVVTLANRNGLVFTQGDGVADASLSFRGTLTAINSALNGLTVTPAPNFIGNSALTITTNDEGNTGAGGAAQDTDTVNFTWSAVNDPPANSVPGPQATVEERPLTFSSTNGNLISISDPDASAGLLQVTLSATGGTLTLGGTAGLTFSTGDGAADATMNFTGTLVNLNAALEGLVFAPTPDFAGTATLTLTSSDLGNSGAGGAKQDVDTVTVNVGAVNDAPVNTVPPAQTTNEDVARVFSSTYGNAISVADVDASSLQVSLSATNGTLTLGAKTGLTFQSGDGTADATMTFSGMTGAINTALSGLTFAPDPNYNGPASLTVFTSDRGATGEGGTLTATSSVVITVVAVNDPPDAVNDLFTVEEDDPPRDFAVLDNDTAAPDTNETLTITAVTPPLHGTATVVGSMIRYQPAANYNGTDSFSYTLSDGNGGTDSATVAITVTPVNDAPTATSDTATVLQNSGPNTIHVLSNDSALPDLGETLTVTAVGTPGHGAAAITGNGAAVTYAPDPSFTGTDTFSYTISDGNGGAASASVTVTVVAVSETPINTLPRPQQTIEDTQLVFSTAAGNAISVTDPNSSTLTVAVTVTNGTFTLAGTNGLNVNGNATATVTLQGAIAALNTALNGARYLPNANFNGPATLTVSTSDNDGNNDVDVLTLTVTSVNDVPINTVPTGTQSATEDVPKTFSNISVQDVDVGADQLLITLTANNGVHITLSTVAGLSFSAGDGVDDETMTFTGTLVRVNAALNGLTLTPPANYIGTSTLTLVSNDQGNSGTGGAGEDTDVITLNWASDNDPPINAVPGPQTIAEEAALTFASTAGTGLSVSDADIAGGLMQITLSATNGTLTLGNPGLVTMVTGDGSADATMSFKATLANVNQALEGTTFTPTVNFVGAAVVTLLSNDLGNTGGAAKSDTDTIAVTVTAVNDAPVNTVPNAQNMNEDTTLQFMTSNGNRISVDDVDATVLQVTLSAVSGTLTLPSKTGLTFQSGTGTSDAAMTFTGLVTSINTALNGLRFTPPANFNGAGSVTVLSKDLGATGAGGALWDEDTVLITVAPVNDPPIATNDLYTVQEDDPPTLFPVLDNDSSGPDVGEVLTITAVTAAQHGAATNNGTTLSYAPAANYNGLDTFSYTVSDGNGGMATATVTVTVVAVNDPPDALDDAITVAQDSAATTVNVLANDTAQPDSGETLKVTEVTQGLHGTAQITGSGTGVTYKPNAGYTGPDEFTYTISDGHGGTDSAKVSVTVTRVDFKPVAADDRVTVPEDAKPGDASEPTLLDVLANDSNLGNEPLTLLLVLPGTPPTQLIQAAHGTTTVTADAHRPMVRYVPAPNFSGTDTFQYQVADADGDTATATVFVTVTGLNDGVPEAQDDAFTIVEDAGNDTTKFAVLANDTALDGPLTLTVTVAPSHGQATAEVDNTITYTPNANFNGTDTFRYTITDADQETSQEAVVTVTVTPVNDAPTAVADVASTRAETMVTVDVLANDVDVDGDALTLVAVTVAPQHGTAVIVNGKIDYTPAAGFDANYDEFTYEIQDPSEATATAKVTVGIGTDSDGDGLLDVDEVAAGTDPFKKDSDDDGLDDYAEVKVKGTDPLDQDSDDDGILDGNEVALGTDPKNPDSDGDGILDGTEIGLTQPQGTGRDTKTDVFRPDADPTTKTDPKDPDTDKDGTPDGVEDANQNGRVDAEETDPLNRHDGPQKDKDADQDGVPDIVDNCPYAANADQTDSNGDGVGDVCTPAELKKIASGCGCGFSGGFGPSVLLAVFALGAASRRRRSRRGAVR